MTRCENDSDSRPTLANTPGELYAIEGAGHVYIGKDDADLRVGFKQPQRFVGVARLQNSKAGLFQEIDAQKTCERLVLDNKNDILHICARLRWFRFHAWLTLGFDRSSDSLLC